VALGIVVVVAAGAVSAWRAGVFSPAASSGTGQQGAPAPGTGNGSPVVLLYGSIPDWRALSESVTGQDVSQLNHDLVDLGYADRADIAALGWDYLLVGDGVCGAEA
jgi:hypothetical protein